MGTFGDPILAGDGELIRDSIRSTDYVPGVSGWRIAADGTSEFSDAVIRGEVLVEGADGTQVRIYNDSAGAAVVELTPIDNPGYGGLDAPARIRAGNDPASGTPGVLFEGPVYGGAAQPSLFMGRSASGFPRSAARLSADQSLDLDADQTTLTGGLTVSGAISGAGTGSLAGRPIVTGNGKCLWGSITATVDGTGSVTVNHSAGFSSGTVIATQSGTGASSPVHIICTAKTATSFTLRFFTASGVVLTGPVSFDFFMGV